MRCNHSYDIDIQLPGITIVILMVIHVFFKDRLSLKNTKKHILLYFIATQYL